MFNALSFIHVADAFIQNKTAYIEQGIKPHIFWVTSTKP